MENGNISKEVAEDDKNRNKESRNLSLLGLECVLFYLDNRKRLELSLYYPIFNIIEKKCSLKLVSLHISYGDINLDGMGYHFDLKNNYMDQITEMKQKIPKLQNVSNRVLQFVLYFFVGRNRFRVGNLRLGFEIPFKLSIDCDTVYLDSKNFRNQAVNYSNVIHKVECLNICRLGSPDDLNCPWIRFVNIVKVYAVDLIYLLPALPNISAKTIIVQLFSEQFYDLIRVWCESRNGIVGSHLFTIFRTFLRFDSNRLVEMGFISESSLRWRLPMNNNSEARLSVRNDYESFCKRYSIGFLEPRGYVCLEVVNV